MSWYKCSNGRITERRLQNNVRSLSYDSYDSLVIFVPPSPLQSCLPASPTPTIQLQRGLAYFLAEYLEWYRVYRLSVSQPIFCRLLKTHALMTKDFYIWHEDSNNFTCHIPSAFSLIYDMCPILSNFAVVFIKCHTWRWYWLDIIVKRPKWRSLLRRNGSFKRIHVKLYTI